MGVQSGSPPSGRDAWNQATKVMIARVTSALTITLIIVAAAPIATPRIQRVSPRARHVTKTTSTSATTAIGVAQPSAYDTTPTSGKVKKIASGVFARGKG